MRLLLCPRALIKISVPLYWDVHVPHTASVVGPDPKSVSGNGSPVDFSWLHIRSKEDKEMKRLEEKKTGKANWVLCI